MTDAQAPGRPIQEAQNRRDEAVLHINEQVAGDTRALLAPAQKEAGKTIAKDAASTCQPGRAPRVAQDVKPSKEQEFVVGGWTEPRQARAHFGAHCCSRLRRVRAHLCGPHRHGFRPCKEPGRGLKLLKARDQTEAFSTRIKTRRARPGAPIW